LPENDSHSASAPDRNFAAAEQSALPGLKPGRYRHYKGRDYLVQGIARHSETEEELVVYRTDYGDRGLWVRPRALFEEMVMVNGCRVPRFQYLGPADAESV